MADQQNDAAMALGADGCMKICKKVMRNAGIAEGQGKLKALRHTFAIEAGQKGVPLNIVSEHLTGFTPATNVIGHAARRISEAELGEG